MDKFFKIKERGSSIFQEIIGGLIVFLAISYILPVNANILSSTGASYDAIFFATAICSAICCILMGVIANFPVALSAGMGVNAYLAFTVCGTMGYSFPQSLMLVLIAGWLFLVLTLTPLREKIIKSIPKSLKYAVSAGLGGFICFVGLKNGGLIKADPMGTYVTLGDFSNPTVLLTLFGVLLVLALMQVKGKVGKLAIVISMGITALVGVVLGLLGVENMPTFVNASVKEGFKAFGGNLGLCFSKEAWSVFARPESYAVIFSLIFVNLFDTTATLIAVGDKVGILDENGDFIGGKKAMLADAIGAGICAPLGTSTVTSFAESTVGAESGAKTGLAACTTGALFILAMFIYPFFSIFAGVNIEGVNFTPVTSLALVSVGCLMFGNLKGIDWSDNITVITTFLIVILMILTYSVSDGLGIGLIAYCVMMMVSKRGKEVPVIIYGVAIFFILNYLLKVLL